MCPGDHHSLKKTKVADKSRMYLLFTILFLKNVIMNSRLLRYLASSSHACNSNSVTLLYTHVQKKFIFFQIKSSYRPHRGRDSNGSALFNRAKAQKVEPKIIRAHPFPKPPPPFPAPPLRPAAVGCLVRPIRSHYPDMETSAADGARAPPSRAGSRLCVRCGERKAALKRPKTLEQVRLVLAVVAPV
jgi:hypothetical protein